MSASQNILFVMYDQLRWDYLGCAGHPHLHTPNFDRVAKRGVRFDRCYIQSPICGASRMSTYTGRYVDSHGASWNNTPLKVGELTLGDHLRDIGMEAWLVGKTHMAADTAGMERLGIARDGIIGARVAECGFDVWVRDDGLWAEGAHGFYDDKPSPYNDFLHAKGYGGTNPWHEHANAGVTEDGDLASGWLLQNADKPANIDEGDSETPWLTDRAIEFMEAKRGGAPWMAHISYIKPHWPYIVPAPYHEMYGPDQVMPVVRDASELEDANPVYAKFANGIIARTFQREEARTKAIGAYMGLIKQCDDQLGRILDYLDETGQAENTMIVLTSDHGDYLGDHWLGEKNLFHDCSARVPLIICDPRARADKTRGTVSEAMIEQIDLAATFIEFAGGENPAHIVEGRSLQPFLDGETPADWRAAAISEYDYSATPVGGLMGLEPADCRMFMVATRDWKLWHFAGGVRPMLFDLRNDPDEMVDLATDPAHAQTLDMMYEHLHAWSMRQSQRTTKSDAQILRGRGGSHAKGVLLGLYDGTEVNPEYTRKIFGKAPQRPQS